MLTDNTSQIGTHKRMERSTSRGMVSIRAFSCAVEMDCSYYGEPLCSAAKANGAACTNKAYYLTTASALRCGVHSKANERSKLAANPEKAANILLGGDARGRSCLAAQEMNRSLGQRGQVNCSKLAMRKEVPHISGYLSVFPNKKHGGRTDGLGLPALSPMNLGPVEHAQPSLPAAMNLENFWQASKLFPSQEMCAKEDHGDCGDHCFRRYQMEMFQSVEAERHNKHSLVSGKKVSPLGWAWTRSDGSTELFSYVESRRFYCTYYERLARTQSEYVQLQALLAEGMNVNIIGYDGRGLKGEGVLEAYLDESKPFGHELCLMAMLTLSREEYPWGKGTA